MNDTINQVGAGAPADWTKTKPTAPGAYWVRGEGLIARRALVEVIAYEGTLWCNLHMRNTDPEFGFGFTVAQLDEEFEWRGPLAPAVPKAQAEQHPVADPIACHCGDLYQADSYGAGFIHGSGMCENCDAAMPARDPITQDELKSIDGNMKLPCEVRLPGGMTIGKGCALSTLLIALRNRDDSMPWRQRFGVPMPFDPRLRNLIAALSAQGGE